MDKDPEAIAILALNNLGYECTRIETGTGPTADLRARRALEELIVECKSVQPDPCTKATEGYIQLDHCRRSSSESAIKKAAKQLRASKDRCDQFGVIFLYSIDYPDAEFMLERAIGELLGLRTASILESSGVNQGYKIINARPSRFERHKHIDAALCLSERGANLYLNEFSAKYTEIKETHLYQVFNNDNAVIDPLNLQDGPYLYCSPEINRADKREIEKHLEIQYSTPKASIIDIQRYIGWSQVNPLGFTGARPTE